MTVLHRLDSILEPSKSAVLDVEDTLDRAGIANREFALVGCTPRQC